MDIYKVYVSSENDNNMIKEYFVQYFTDIQKAYRYKIYMDEQCTKLQSILRKIEVLLNEGYKKHPVLFSLKCKKRFNLYFRYKDLIAEHNYVSSFCERIITAIKIPKIYLDLSDS